MLLRKQNRFVDAKTLWSVRTRAAIVRLGLLGKLILRARKLNHVVAAGPKTPSRCISVSQLHDQVWLGSYRRDPVMFHVHPP